jgi:hypothetical protein
MAIDRLFITWQFVFAIKDQLHSNIISNTSKNINVETRKSKKSNKKA